MSEVYEHELVYIGSVKTRIAEGWEPTPDTAQVNKYVGGAMQYLTYVWMRRLKCPA